METDEPPVEIDGTHDLADPQSVAAAAALVVPVVIDALTADIG